MMIRNAWLTHIYNSFWGWFRSTFEICDLKYEWIYFYNLVETSLHTVIYSCLITLTITTLYYIVISDDEEDFQRRRWPRAKSIAIILVCIIILTICLLCCFSVLLENLIQSNDHSCGQVLIDILPFKILVLYFILSPFCMPY